MENKFKLDIQVFLSLGIIALFMPVYLSVSLSKERLQAAAFWMTIPANGFQLYGSKLIAGFLALLSLTLFSVLFTIGAIAVFESPEYLLSQKLIWCFFILQFGFGIGVLVIFISALMASFNQYLPKKRGFLTFTLFSVFFIGIFYFVTTDVYTLFSWGSISIPSLFGIPQTEVPIDLRNVYLGELLFDTIINLTLFLISSWLFDKKVEV